MSTYCLEKSEQLHADYRALKAIEVTDAESLCAYIKSWWEFIINHKMFGCIWDIYADEIEVRRENGFALRVMRHTDFNTAASFVNVTTLIGADLSRKADTFYIAAS